MKFKLGSLLLLSLSTHFAADLPGIEVCEIDLDVSGISRKSEDMNVLSSSTEALARLDRSDVSSNHGVLDVSAEGIKSLSLEDVLAQKAATLNQEKAEKDVVTQSRIAELQAEISRQMEKLSGLKSAYDSAVSWVWSWFSSSSAAASAVEKPVEANKEEVFAQMQAAHEIISKLQSELEVAQAYVAVAGDEKETAAAVMEGQTAVGIFLRKAQAYVNKNIHGNQAKAMEIVLARGTAFDFFDKFSESLYVQSAESEEEKANRLMDFFMARLQNRLGVFILPYKNLPQLPELAEGSAATVAEKDTTGSN